MICNLCSLYFHRLPTPSPQTTLPIVCVLRKRMIERSCSFIATLQRIKRKTPEKYPFKMFLKKKEKKKWNANCLMYFKRKTNQKQHNEIRVRHKDVYEYSPPFKMAIMLNGTLLFCEGVKCASHLYLKIFLKWNYYLPRRRLFHSKWIKNRYQ